MLEKYYLNDNKLPILPTPHDCEIIEIEYKDGFLIFKFGSNLNLYDSIKFNYPNANSLIIKYHLTDPRVFTYIWKNIGKSYKLVDNRKIIRKHKQLTYLYQYVSYESIIIKLFKSSAINVEFDCDYIEYEWI